MAGDFFVDVLPEGDLYSLGRILHDWTESKILLLLKRIHDRLPSGGALLIAEKLLEPDKSGPLWAQMQNLNMLALHRGERANPRRVQGDSRTGRVHRRCWVQRPLRRSMPFWL